MLRRGFLVGKAVADSRVVRRCRAGVLVFGKAETDRSTVRRYHGGVLIVT